MSAGQEAAAQLRAQIPSSTDPDRLERMARAAEGRAGPQRIRLSRRKGWRKPFGAVVVARPSKWGNPYLLGAVPADGRIDEQTQREDVVRWYRQDLEDRLRAQPNLLAELRGKDLACWCPIGQPCHADVLLELANRNIDQVTT